MQSTVQDLVQMQQNCSKLDAFQLYQAICLMGDQGDNRSTEMVAVGTREKVAQVEN